jgi:hypothetical protein
LSVSRSNSGKNAVRRSERLTSIGFEQRKNWRRQRGDFEGSLKAVAKEVGSAVGVVTATIEKALSEVSEMKEAVGEIVTTDRAKR